MPSFHLPHFNDIAILRSIELNRFRTFLLRFDNYLRSQGFTIPELRFSQTPTCSD
ncbi:hypothetical protein VN12_24350 [Pirellula sp. SH-Sr6A]|nr:hypothetical protein VN12_24350 [Pirellula sp. SH-Sr6A]